MTTPPRTGAQSDPAVILLRTLLASAPLASAAELVEMTSTSWASATFVGARHVIRLIACDDDALAIWLAGLSEAQFRLGRHLLVDLAVASVIRSGTIADIAIEALTIEDA
ncbi:hypothetical protein [uncultured Sphingomonas sp.]|uniref:hypothetical protein n=1 Tax=uncultured Sphingomonas sp. TaxID=158754 RepID=UPI0035CB3193